MFLSLEISCFSKVRVILIAKQSRNSVGSPVAFGRTCRAEALWKWARLQEAVRQRGLEAGLWSDMPLRQGLVAPGSRILLHTCPGLSVKWVTGATSKGRKLRRPISRPSAQFYFLFPALITLFWRQSLILDRVQSHGCVFKHEGKQDDLPD